MSPGDALGRLKAASRDGSLLQSRHARLRMAERQVGIEELASAIRNCASCRWSDEHGTWNAVGTTFDGDSLRISFRVEPRTVIVTVLWE